jgi:hypothetical protein
MYNRSNEVTAINILSYFIVSFFSLFLTVGSLNADTDHPVRSVFVLHSYSQEYPWTHGQHKGFVDALEADQKGDYDL